MKLTQDLILYSFFLFYIFLSILWSENPEFGIIKFIHLCSQTIFLLSLFMIFYEDITSIKIAIELIGIIILIVSLVLSILIIQGSLFYFKDFILIKKSIITHVYSGRLISLVLLILLITRTNFPKFIEAIIISILSFGIANTAYRTVIIGLILSVLAYFFISCIKKEKMIIKTSQLIFLVAIIIALVSSKNFRERIPEEKFFEIKKDISLVARIEMWKEGINLWKQNKIFGAGFGSFYNTDESGTQLRKLIYPHNFFIETLAEIGIIGLIILMLGLYYSISTLINSKPFYWSLFVYFFILSLTSKDITINFILLLFPQIILSTSRILKNYI